MTTPTHSLTRVATTHQHPSSPPAPAQQPAPSKAWDRVSFAHSADPLIAETLAETTWHGPVPSCSVTPGDLAGGFTRNAIEALLGVRPAAQLVRWCTAGVYEALVRRVNLGLRLHGRPRRARHARVRSVHISEPRPGVAEAAVVVFDSARMRAAAVRMEIHRHRWRVTAFEIG